MNNKYIIKLANDFSKIINNGKRIKGENIIIYYLQNNSEKVNFGFAVSKKLGNAVVRNNVKRRLRHITRMNQNLFPKGYNYIIMIRREGLSLPLSNWNNDLINIIGKVK